MKSIGVRSLCVTGAILAAACAGSDEPRVTEVVPPAVRQVVVEVDSTVIERGHGSAARATAYDRLGFPLTGRAVSWSTDSTGVLSVVSPGVISARAAGRGKVFAVVDGVRGEQDVVVLEPAVVALVDVALASLVVMESDTVRAVVYVRDSLGSAIRGRTPAWSMEGEAGVATVSSTGLVRALSPGVAKVVAVVDSVRGELEFLVTARPGGGTVSSVLITLISLTMRVGDTTTAQARAYDPYGSEVAIPSISWSAGNPAVATVTNSGLLTAVTPGAASVSATVAGVVGTRTFTVLDSAAGSVVLPRLPDTLSFTYPTVTGRQWIVGPGGNLQSALNQARRGDEIVLAAGATFTGNFTLPTKSGTPADGWILIRSERSAQLPPRGVRVTPALVSLMPRIETTNTSPALVTALGASGWWISGVEFGVTPTVTIQNGIVEFGIGGAPQTELATVPTDLVLDRVVIRAQPTTNTSRCLELNSARSMVTDSYLTECHGKGFDSQAIVGWNGPGPFRIENNTLIGAGENIMFGGADPTIPGLVPADVVIRGNYIFTPPSWITTWTKKNLFETKNVERVLIEGNVFDGSWADAQTGYALLLKVSNQSGRCTWCAVRDVTIRYNVIRNAGAAIDISGNSGANNNPIAERLNRLLIEHNLIEDINVGVFRGDGTMIQLVNNVQNVTIRHNSMTTTGAQKVVLAVGRKPAATNLDFSSNAFTLGQYGIFSSAFGIGEIALQGVDGSRTFSRNVIVGPQKPGYPNASFVSTLAIAQGTGAGANRIRLQQLIANVVVP